jgi:hypothetical protein
VEGYKHGPFPRVEVYRAAQHDPPVYDPADPEADARWLAVVTDVPGFRAGCPVVPIDPGDPAGAHVEVVADLLERHLGGEADG